MGGLSPAVAPPGRWVTALIVAVAVLPRLWTAVTDHGIFWPDEIYQSLEPAHWLAFGYGYLAWEFVEGARSWLYPGVLGVWLWLLALCGLEQAPALVIGAKLLMAAVSVLGVYGSLRLARALGGEMAGWLGGLIAAALPVLVLFGSRCMAETVSGTLIVFAAFVLVRRAPTDAALAGVLCGLAVFLRYPNGFVLVGFLALLAVARRFTELRQFALAALGVGWLGGLLDWATWGAPFHSLRVYIDYNLRHQADLYGTAGPGYYLMTLWSATGPALVALAAGLLVALRRWTALTLVTLAYGAVHSAIGHKEIRFLLPVLPVAAALAGAGLAALLERRLASRSTVLLGAALAAVMAHRASALTFADAGQYVGEPAGAVSPWHAGEGVNRLLWFAGQQDDLCGLWLTGMRPAWAAGYSYLHRDVPYLRIDTPEAAPHANYAIAPSAPVPFPLAWYAPAAVPAEFRPIAGNRGWVLLRRDGPCAPLAGAG